MVRSEKGANVEDRDGFAARLRQVVDAYGSTSSFARALGRSEGAVRKWLRGESEPGVSDLRALCKLTGTGVEWLVLGTGSRLGPLAISEARTSAPASATPKAPMDYGLLDAVMATLDVEAKALNIELPRLKRSFMTGTLYERFAESKQVDREYVSRMVALAQVEEVEDEADPARTDQRPGNADRR